MSARNAITIAAAALLASALSPAFAQSSPNHGNLHLSPEQQAMMFMDAHDKLRSMPPDQRKTFRQQLRQQFASMTPSQKLQQQRQLDAEWNAMPAARKEKIETHLQQQAANHEGAASDGEQ